MCSSIYLSDNVPRMDMCRVFLIDKATNRPAVLYHNGKSKVKYGAFQKLKKVRSSFISVYRFFLFSLPSTNHLFHILKLFKLTNFFISLFQVC